MINTINPPNLDPAARVDMWQFPAGHDAVDGDTAEVQQSNYADYLMTADPESQAVEQGLPLAPIREGAANNVEAVPSVEQLTGYETNTGQVVDPLAAEAVLTTANQIVSAAYEAAPEAQQARLREEHHRAANALAAEFGPKLEVMREGALRQSDLELAA